MSQAEKMVMGYGENGLEPTPEREKVRQLTPWNIFDIPPDVEELNLRDALDGKLSMIQGVLNVVAGHPEIHGSAEASGICESAWGASLMVDEVRAILAALKERSKAKDQAKVRS